MEDFFIFSEAKIDRSFLHYFLNDIVPKGIPSRPYHHLLLFWDCPKFYVAPSPPNLRYVSNYKKVHRSVKLGLEIIVIILLDRWVKEKTDNPVKSCNVFQAMLVKPYQLEACNEKFVGLTCIII